MRQKKSNSKTVTYFVNVEEKTIEVALDGANYVTIANYTPGILGAIVNARVVEGCHVDIITVG